MDGNQKRTSIPVYLKLFTGIKKIRQGKLFDIDLDTDNKEEAEKLTKEICKVLLANMVIEDYTIILPSN